MMDLGVVDDDEIGVGNEVHVADWVVGISLIVGGFLSLVIDVDRVVLAEIGDFAAIEPES